MNKQHSADLIGKYRNHVVDMAARNAESGGLPFAAIIIDRHGRIIGKGVNRVAGHMDCTAHAEIEAIREASLKEKTVSLQETTLIASGEPCALCYMAIRMAEIPAVIVISDRYDTAAKGFSYLWTYRYLNNNLFEDIDVMQADHNGKTFPIPATGKSNCDQFPD
jgi:guanine deaminase